MVDLEQFPTSPTAKRMLKTVSPIYEKSYVGKWLFQVMGAEYDEVWQIAEELRLQAAPETATWGIVYWEQRYHIPPDESLTLEERRNRVILKRGKRGPMNPARIEQIVTRLCGREARVTEAVADYTFLITILPRSSEVNYNELIDTIRSVKPSHLAFEVLFETAIDLSVGTGEQRTYPFDYILAGTVPDTNMLGSINRESIMPAIASGGSDFDYQFCGEEERDL